MTRYHQFELHSQWQQLEPLSLNIPHPNQAQLVNQSALRRANIDSQNRKDNTKLAYDAKIAEFRNYCNHRMKEDDPTAKYTVTYIKTHEFMFYQAMRPCRKRGDKRKRDNLPIFDGEEFTSIITEYKYCSCTHLDWPESDNPLGYAQLNTYKAAIHNYHDEQVDNNINNPP
jgi:hypothetical protein